MEEVEEGKAKGQEKRYRSIRIRSVDREKNIRERGHERKQR